MEVRHSGAPIGGGDGGGALTTKQLDDGLAGVRVVLDNE